ncbi:TetR/AcrR family transcriptional regulator [Nonomuraea aurantiaca]|uniref:TetR/AcrR family transcriptional regulator n=1 Tax=Nonomuraea aurantiaca TaxID=2878562 RepID=UPI0027DF61A4|nr:TetR/AcrR family transcriptional regulator [Nonomuraea aurantiaca]
MAERDKRGTAERLGPDDWARAALAALAEGGLGAVAVEPVAVRLGVSKGSFYWHFANRRALVEAALAQWEAGTERVIARLESLDEPVTRMRTLLDLAFGDAENAAISFRLISEVDDPLVGEVVRRVSRRRLDFMQEVLRELGQPEGEARRRVLAAYGGYLGLAALVRIGAADEVPGSLVDLAMAELGLPPAAPS